MINYTAFPLKFFQNSDKIHVSSIFATQEVKIVVLIRKFLKNYQLRGVSTQWGLRNNYMFKVNHKDTRTTPLA